MATPTSPDVEALAAQRTITPPPAQSEQSPVAYCPQGATQGDPNPSSYRDLTDVSAQHQAMSLSQPQLEKQAYFQPHRDQLSVSPDPMGADRELDRRTDAGAAGRVADEFDIDSDADATRWGADSTLGGTPFASSESMEGSEMDDSFMDWDGNGS